MLSKKLLLSFLLFTSSKVVTAQGKHYDLIKDDACNCLTKLKSQGKVGYTDFQNCLRSAIQNHGKLMYQEVFSQYAYPDSILYQKSYVYGQALGHRLDTALVYSCDTYFTIADSLRHYFLYGYNQDSLLTLLNKINSFHSKLSPSLLEQRARLNLLTQNHEAALMDAEELLKQQPKSVLALTIEGYAYEGLKRYDEAALAYYKLTEVTGQAYYLVWAAIANRKSQRR